MYINRVLESDLIYLIRPSKLYEKKILEFKEEFLANNETISGGELLDKLDFSEWLNYVNKNSNKDTVSPDWVLTDIFFAVEEEEFVGVISFRHKLNDFLKEWGHVGYSVRPSKRRKGYASTMLSEVLSLAKRIGLNEVQLSSYEDNVASVKTILKNGGVFIRSFKYLDNVVNVYIISLSPARSTRNICC